MANFQKTAQNSLVNLSWNNILIEILGLIKNLY
jgi:hypothetical protein